MISAGPAAKALARALGELVEKRGRRALLLSRVDSEASASSPLAPYLEDEGFEAGSSGHVKRAGPPPFPRTGKTRAKVRKSKA